MVSILMRCVYFHSEAVTQAAENELEDNGWLLLSWSDAFSVLQGLMIPFPVLFSVRSLSAWRLC